MIKPFSELKKFIAKSKLHNLGEIEISFSIVPRGTFYICLNYLPI
jgi:hypothetical protein